MSNPRVTHPVDPKSGHDCDRMNLDSYLLREVVLPGTKAHKERKAIEIEVRGRNLRAAAQPLTVSVGKTYARWIRIAPDERSVSGVLLEEPEPGAFVEVRLGEQDHVRHPTPVDPSRIERIDSSP